MRTTSLRRFAARVDAATPPERDRAIDALRAFAILGVVLGHWLVTAIVVDSGSIHVVSPLQHMPAFTPVSWIFQTLAVFFLVGGQVATKSYTSAKARGDGYLTWLWARLFRLFRPVLAVLAVWAVTASALLFAGVGFGTVEALVKLVLSPMWFLLVFAVLTAATPLVSKLNPLWPLAVVLHVDLIRFAFHGPAWLGWLNLPAGWLVPYCLGAMWAREGLRGRTTGWVLLIGGAVATALLVTQAGYPASMVGVPGAKISNLNPPTLAAVTFGLAQCGLALLLLGPLRRVLARPAAWAAVAVVNLSAMTIFLWHQTSMIAVTALGLLAGEPLLGLHTTPDTASWILARLAWLPVFATMLSLCWLTFRHHEQGRRKSRTIRVAGSPGSEKLRPVVGTLR
ncbi:acyltransferase family protein [Streptacidiphilus jiangxiensis]|uniref:Acyltransferase family protein n=1 Tax=Streptacidiphilus jiangxiensis TaxID=235985 RepID=A0A1H7V8Z1_STRJI|nr:acyltransferase [Streptacidiphilus jiangxiensis]SEM05514.1 Acyltransferase family protein [Streptacidiphilus jiangxiensis]